jgi:hypothetical protein
MYSRSPRGVATLGFGLVGLLTVGGLVLGVATVTHTETKRGCVVESKDRTSKSDGTSDARIYTENCGVLQVADSLTKGKFNSADRYQKIKVGQTYDFYVQGYRIGFFSQFPNIIEATPVG